MGSASATGSRFFTVSGIAPASAVFFLVLVIGIAVDKTVNVIGTARNRRYVRRHGQGGPHVSTARIDREAALAVESMATRSRSLGESTANPVEAGGD